MTAVDCRLARGLHNWPNDVLQPGVKDESGARGLHAGSVQHGRGRVLGSTLKQHRRPRTAILAALTLLVAAAWLGGLDAPVHAAAAGTPFPVTASTGEPEAINSGPDGSLWFTDLVSGSTAHSTDLVRMTTGGASSLVASLGSIGYGDLAAGPDGAMWLTSGSTLQGKSAAIIRVTVGGSVTTFALPATSSTDSAESIAAGPDGAMWFTSVVRNQIGRITMAGSITMFDLPTPNARPYFITPGPDGALWFAEVNGIKIGRITTSGRVTEFAVPGPGIAGLAFGPDGNLWFTQYNGGPGNIGQMTLQGAVSTYPLPDSTYPGTIASGPDGAMWFTTYTTSSTLGRITMSGAVSFASVPLTFPPSIAPFASITGASLIRALTVGPDGALWFPSFDYSSPTTKIPAIGRYAVGVAAPASVTCSASEPTATSTAGYWLAASDGGIFNYGSAGFFGSAGGIHLNKPIVGMAATPDGQGYWLVASDGGIFNYGDAAFCGSAGGIHLNSPIVGMATVPTSTSTEGYWLAASDGGIFNYGSAGFFGSAGGIHLNKPIVGMAATPDGQGYWLVASDGGVFNYGDAGFLGSAGGTPLNKPIVGMAATPDGHGYWLVASDGGVFNYGSAGFFGSAGGIHLSKPIVGMAATPDGQGYWLVASDGGVFNYGDAGFLGSAGGTPLNKPIVAGA
jgi:streptogramin lyase